MTPFGQQLRGQRGPDGATEVFAAFAHLQFGESVSHDPHRRMVLDVLAVVGRSEIKHLEGDSWLLLTVLPLAFPEPNRWSLQVDVRRETLLSRDNCHLPQ